jgi:hypothetical protein
LEAHREQLAASTCRAAIVVARFGGRTHDDATLQFHALFEGRHGIDCVA